jgi:hypothetical protein
MEIMILGGQLSKTTAGDWRFVVAARGKTLMVTAAPPAWTTHARALLLFFFGTIIWLAFYTACYNKNKIV